MRYLPTARLGAPLLFSVIVVASSGCTSIVNSVTEQLASDLTAAILNSDDPATVEAGAPAYLILIDSLLRSAPDNGNLLQAAATLNGAFASSFVDDEAREKLMTTKALDYAERAACVRRPNLCGLRALPFDRFQAVVAATDASDLEALYRLGMAWGGWIQAHTDDFSAIAELSRVRAVAERSLALDERFDYGGPHLAMGILETILPAALGGKPDKGKMHFEKAIAISEGQYLMAKVMYAQQYARLVFDRELHDRLLREVLDADPVVTDLTLVNRLAQMQAEGLLAESAEYF